VNAQPISTTLDLTATAPNPEAGKLAACLLPEGTPVRQCGPAPSAADFSAFLEAAETANNLPGLQNPVNEAQNHNLPAATNERKPEGETAAELELLASIAWSLAAQTAVSQPKPLPNAEQPLPEPEEQGSQSKPATLTTKTEDAPVELGPNSTLKPAQQPEKSTPEKTSAQQTDESVPQTTPTFELDNPHPTTAETKKPQTALIEAHQKPKDIPQAVEDKSNASTPPVHMPNQAQNSAQVARHSVQSAYAHTYAPQPSHETFQIHSAFWLERNADGSGRLLLELRPPALGPIEVLVSAKGTSVSADLIAPDQNAFELLQNHLGALQEALVATGLSVDTLQVDVATRDEHKHAEDRFRKTNRVRYISEPTISTPVLGPTIRTGLRRFSTLDLVA